MKAIDIVIFRLSIKVLYKYIFFGLANILSCIKPDIVFYFSELSARKMKMALDLMRSFASKTHKRWNSNQLCKVDLIIAYSQQDGVVSMGL